MKIYQKDKSFIEHLYAKLSMTNLVGTKPYVSKHIDKKYNKTREAYRFNTLTFPYFF